MSKALSHRFRFPTITFQRNPDLSDSKAFRACIGSVTVNLSFLDCICSLELPHKVINQTKPPVNDATRTSASNTKNLMRVDGIGQIQMTSIIH